MKKVELFLIIWTLQSIVYRDVKSNFKFRYCKKLRYTSRIIDFYSNTPFHLKRNTAVSILLKWLNRPHLSFNDKSVNFRIYTYKYD